MPEAAMRRRTAARWLFAVTAVVAVALALRDQGDELRSSLADLGVPALLLSQAAVLVGLLCSAHCWRALLAALGHPLGGRDALHVFFVGQIGKYLPGNVFALAAQAELARDHHVPRSRVVAAGLVFLGVLTTTGLLVAAATLPFRASGALRTYAWALPFLPVGLLLLVPRVLNSCVALLLRTSRRAPLDAPLAGRHVVVASGWALAMWGCYGLHVVPLIGEVSGEAVMLGLGGYALAWTAGFLFVVAPAGAVVREAVLVLVLAAVLSRPDATAVALASRLVQTLGDILWAVAGWLLGRRRQG